MTDKLAPPASLVARGPGRRWWRDVCSDFAPSPYELPLMQLAAEALDRQEAARKLVGDDLLTPGTRGGLRPNPGLAVEAMARRQFLASWRALDWRFDDAADSRPRLAGRFASRFTARASG